MTTIDSRLVGVAALSLWLGACGLKGDLFLPDDAEAAPATGATPAAEVAPPAEVVDESEEKQD